MTPHIESKKEDIADLVLMPGDPKRATYIAEHYLSDYKLVNNVRGMSAYTGHYKNKLVTIFPSGMGIPSMGIYSYELFKYYDVKKIIRIGTAGGYDHSLNLNDLILVEKAITDSTYGINSNGDMNNYRESSSNIKTIIKNTSDELDISIRKGNIYSSDVFYSEISNYEEVRDKYQVLGVEMESFALFHNAKLFNRDAACLLTISDLLFNDQALTSEEREKSLNKMIELGLNAIIKE